MDSFTIENICKKKGKNKNHFSISNTFTVCSTLAKDKSENYFH